jgi:hypothetical protein
LVLSDPASTDAIRMVVGGPLLGRAALFLKGHPVRGRWPTGSVLLCIAIVTAFQYCFFKAVHLTGVAEETMVAIGCSPNDANHLNDLFPSFLSLERR